MLNLTDVQVPNSILPAGSYTAVVTGVETKNTKSGDGQYIQVEFTISSHGNEGRKIWDNFNIKNANQKAVDIGLGKLKSMALAMGFTEAALSKFDPSQLANKEVGLKTKVKLDPAYGDKAEVASYTAIKNLPTHSQIKESDIGF